MHSDPPTKSRFDDCESDLFLMAGRGERIRTSGPCLPKAVLYQAELHPDLVRPLDREAGEGGESLCVGRFGNFRQAGKGGIGLFSREARSVVEPPGRFNSTPDWLQVIEATTLYGLAN